VPTPADDDLQTRLREARRGVGLTQQQVADKLGASRRAVSEWELGQRRPHSKLPELAKLYGVSTSYLLEGVESAPVELSKLSKRLDELDEAVTRNYELLAGVATRLDRLGENVALLVESLPLDRNGDVAGHVRARTTRPSVRSRD
jgi:transcriptional regulator with XRE-family HTH domain